MPKTRLTAPSALLALPKLWSIGQALATLALLAGVIAPAVGHAKKGKRPPPRETYSAYDPAQDPAADQSSTFEEPEYLESLGPPAPTAPIASAPAKALPAAVKGAPAKSKRVSQLPSAVKAPPKVTVRSLPKSATVSSAKAEAAPVPAPPPAPALNARRPVLAAPAPAAAPAMDLDSLRGAVERARFSLPASVRLMPLKEYVTQSCEAWRGIRDYLLEDGHRADCVTLHHAFAFAHADAGEEAAARALRYAKLSGLPPAVALVVESEADLAHVEALVRYRSTQGLRFEIKKVMLPDVSRALAR